MSYPTDDVDFGFRMGVNVSYEESHFTLGFRYLRFEQLDAKHKSVSLN